MARGCSLSLIPPPPWNTPTAYLGVLLLLQPCWTQLDSSCQ